MYIILRGSVLIRKKCINKSLGEVPFITWFDGESFGEQEIVYSGEEEGKTALWWSTAIASEETYLLAVPWETTVNVFKRSAGTSIDD